ncbi:c-type cytochrome [Thiobacter aerophilum]|uniref:C-type cytochrome n=1 Tax=Thiobacter aerophilum TaxID=3121275 RepID=A0ABV0EEI1_9BURK
MKRSLLWVTLGLVTASLGAHAQEVNKHARILAAPCAACHGTNGNSVGGTPVLAGADRAHFILQMKEFKSGARPATVMHQHARGYTDEEIEMLADFFAAQKRGQ